MIDYVSLKKSYISALQMGLVFNAGYENAKQGNELLHKFCENCIDNSSYNEFDKDEMKKDLNLVKEMLSREIERYYS